MKNKDDQANFTVVFRTGKQWEYDMVLNTLKENGIPNQSREESGGISVAMPLRATPGPGVWWAVLVPERNLIQAKEILAELPIEIKTDAGVWDFAPTKSIKRWWQIYLSILLALAIFWAIFDLIKTIGK